MSEKEGETSQADKSFPRFKLYCESLLKNHYDALSKDLVKRAYKAELPVSKLLNDSDETFLDLSKKSFAEDILVPVANDLPFERIRQKLDDWKIKSLSAIGEKLQVRDVISIFNIRRQSLLSFIDHHQYPKEELAELIEEINAFIDHCIDMVLKTYEEVQVNQSKTSNEILSSILSSTPVIITKLNKEGKILLSKGAGLRTLGIGDNELTGKNVFDLYPDSDFTRKALNGHVVSFIRTATTASGELKEFQSFYIPDKDGTLGFSIDITRQREAEEQLSNLVEGVKDYAIFMLTPDGMIATWNEGAQALKGYTKEEIIGKHFSIFYPQHKQDERFPEYELEQAKKTGRFEDEGIRLRKDGSTFWANVVITAIYNQDKKLLGFTKITRDLTERKQAEEILRRSEERYRLLIEGVKDYAIFHLDPEGNISSWNEGAKRLKGYSEEEIIGKHFSIFYPQQKRDERFPEYELEQAKKTGRFEDEGVRLRKDGSTFYANVVITAMFDSQKQHIGFSKITRDLTERKNHEENLRKINAELEDKVRERTEELLRTIKDLEKTNNDLDNFIYTASHDLKAPISNIEGLINSLYDELKFPLESNPLLMTIKDLIDASIKRFQTTIKDLTEVAKVQKDSLENEEQVNLTELIQDITITIMDLVVKNDAEIITNLNGNEKIKFVRKNLQSILYNLISNGIKYRSPDKKPVIKIEYHEDNTHHLISIQDNGLGIRAEDQDKMFTMFKRFHSHVEGSGIGLYIVKRIIENAGGRIEVKSTEGKGTIFNIWLRK